MIALLPIAAVVAALAGPGVPVTCGPLVQQYGLWGMAMQQGPAEAWQLELDNSVCADYASPAPATWGPALLAVVHESEHAALDTYAEADVECHAVQLWWAFTVPVFAHELGGDAVARAVAIQVADTAWVAAAAYDASLPPAYHLPAGQPCGP